MAKTRRHDGQKKAVGKTKLCGAKKTDGSGTCKHPAGWGTPHNGRGRCKWHGGSTPTHVKAAETEVALEAVELFGLPREIEPADALLEEVHRSAGLVGYYEQRIRERLDEANPDALVFGVTKDTADTEGARKIERRAVPSAWLALYRTERKHLVDVCRVAIAAGIAERQVQLAEQQGMLIAQVIRGVLEDLGVADDPEVPAIVRRHLTLVDSAA